MRLIQYIFNIFIFCCLPNCLFAQASLPVSYLGLEQGLSNNGVTKIYQDKNGFMWFATYEGLNKYDGYDFKVFKNRIGDSNSLVCNLLHTIDGDLAGGIWVGGQRGAAVLQPLTATFTQVRYKEPTGHIKLLTDEVHLIKAAGKQGLLIGTLNTGLVRFDAGSLTGKPIPLLGEKGALYNYDVPAMEYDSLHNQVFVFVRNRGLYLYKFSTGEMQLINQEHSQVNFLRMDRNGRLWLGSERGLFLLNPQTSRFSANLMPLVCTISDLRQDPEGNLWIGSDGEGVWKMAIGETNPQKAFYTEGITPLNSNAVSTLYVDKDGRKWIGTMRGGINIVEASELPFKKIQQRTEGKNNSLANFINSFCEDNQGNIWIGTSGGGLRYWSRTKSVLKEFVNRSQSPGSISSSFVTSIVQDNNNDIWISTWNGGVNRLNKSTQTFERYPCYNPAKRQEELNIWFLFEDRQKRLWASATNNEGSLYLLNRTSNQFEPFDSRITNVQTMTEDRQGHLWAGTYSDLVLLDPIKKQHVFYRINNTVRSIYESADGNFWVGTQDAGLLAFSRTTAKYRPYTTIDGLPGNSVLRILEDHHSNLWFSSFNGLSCFSTKTRQIRNFSTSDGLQSTQFSYNAALKLKSGEMLFGGINGFNIFNPDSNQSKIWMPPLRITALHIDNQPLEKSLSFISKKETSRFGEITLPYNQAVISVQFAALEFSAPEKIAYAYYLQGWDKGWNYQATNRTASYTRLTEGSYLLRIKNTNARGEWSNHEETLLIKVLPPWYRSWWAYAGYILLSVAAIYLYLRYKRKQTHLEFEVKLAHLEVEKEKELNEKKLNFFTNISHEFRTPLTLIIGPIKDILYQKNTHTDPGGLNTVYRNARRLLSLVDQLLLFRKADTYAGQLRVSHTNFSDLCQEVFLCFTQQAESKQIEYEWMKPPQPLEVYLDREKMEIALFNLISNAIKYTPAGGKVKVEVSGTEEQVIVIVSDNGPGIPAETGSKLFERFYQIKDSNATTGFGIGLFVAKTTVESHKGQLKYESPGPGLGTRFFLSLPTGRNHFDKNVVFEDSKGSNGFLEELMEEPAEKGLPETDLQVETAMDSLAKETKTLLLVDDNGQIRQYLAQIFATGYKILQAETGEEGLKLARLHTPDLIISDVVMSGMSGIELCKQIKDDTETSHITVILLTASSAADIKLKGIECGADDYITKPFEKEQLVARVENLLRSRNVLQKYFFNEITLQKNNLKISGEYKLFLERCMAIVEENIDREDFSIKTLATEMGMSHSNLYKKIKSISGQSANAFIRFIRLRKAARLLIDSECNISEAAFQVGFSDTRYFRDQFHQLFGINPSDYIKKYRQPFQKKYAMNEKIVNREA